MTTLENLYYGNIAPHEYEVVRGREYMITAKLVFATNGNNHEVFGLLLKFF